MAAGLIGCALPAAVSTPGAASTAQHAVSVNRINKGDRLSREVTLKRTPAVSSPGVSVAGRLLIGCDPAFSRAADPERAHILGDV